MILIIKHVTIEGPGLISNFFEERKFTTSIVDLEKGDRLPNCLDKMEGVIMLGGPMNVYEEKKYPFLKEEDAFIKKAIKRGIPLLGICLGAQLIAKAAGAVVRREDFKEIGWHSITVTSEGKRDFLFEGMGETMDVFQWHEDAFEIPAGAVLLAESAKCPQTFRIGDSVYAFQFHFEITPVMITEWVSEYSDDESLAKDPSRAPIMIQHAYKKHNAYYRQATAILSKFCDLIRQKEVTTV